MILILILLSVTSFTNAGPTQTAAPYDIIYGNAIDTFQLISSDTWADIAKSGYDVAFVRAYTNLDQGSFDINATYNFYGADAVNIGVEVYMTPNPTSYNSLAVQVQDTFYGLQHYGILARTIWLQVVTPKLWYADVNTNIQNIASYMVEINSLGLKGGIYTSAKDWNSITGNWKGAKNLMLWYTDVQGAGFAYETSRDFDEFKSFGGWTVPSVKQYSQNITISGAYPVSRNVFSEGRTPKKLNARKKEGSVSRGIPLTSSSNVQRKH